MLKIKSKFGLDFNSFDFQQINAPEFKFFKKETDIKKTVGVTPVFPKLIKIGADTLAEPLTQAINCCLGQGIFPDNAKIVSVVPAHKGKPDKYDVLNFRPVSILNAFSKIYEKVIKNQLVSYFEKYLSPSISAYRKLQHLTGSFSFVRGIERKIRQQGAVVGAVLMDLSKTFDCIPDELIIAKLAAYGVVREALRLIYFYLKGRKQYVKINNTYRDYNEIIFGFILYTLVCFTEYFHQ